MLPTFSVCGLLLLGKESVAAAVTSLEVLHLERRLSSNSTNPTPSHNIELNATQFGQRFGVEAKLGNESFFSGLPPVLYDPTFATVPVEIAPIPLNYTTNKRQISWWTIMVDAVAYGTNGISQNRSWSTDIHLLNTGLVPISRN